MIKVVENPNIKGWYQIFKVENLIDEIRSQSLAMRKAQRIARKNGYSNFSLEKDGREKLINANTLTSTLDSI
jgi:hypothetical protein